jgi:hypothetical protein
MKITIDTDSLDDRQRFRQMAKNYLERDWLVTEAMEGLQERKPEEVFGIGAVIEVRGERRKHYIRLHDHAHNCNDWYPVNGSGYSAEDVGALKGRRTWTSLDVVKVVSEGVTLR